MLATVNLKAADWSPGQKLSRLLTIAAEAAEHVGEYEIANKRAFQALDLSRDANDLMAISVMGSKYAIWLVTADRHAEALDLLLQSMAASEALSTVRSQGGNIQTIDRSAEEIIGPKPSAAWNRVESLAVTFGAFPIMLRLAIESLNSFDKATAMAKEVIAAIDIVRRTASDVETWDALRAIFLKSFVEGKCGSILREMGNDYSAKQKPSLQAIAFTAATIQGDVRPEAALVTHLYIVAEAKTLAPPAWPVYRNLVLPFLEQYWGRIFNEQAFRFTPPSLYRTLFAEAKAQPVERRAQAILQLGFRGFNIPVPDRYRDWIAGSW